MRNSAIQQPEGFRQRIRYRRRNRKTRSQRNKDGAKYQEALFGTGDSAAQEQQRYAEKRQNNAGLDRANDPPIRRATLHAQRIEELPSRVGLYVRKQVLCGIEFFNQPGLNIRLQPGDLEAADGAEYGPEHETERSENYRHDNDIFVHKCSFSRAVHPERSPAFI